MGFVPPRLIHPRQRGGQSNEATLTLMKAIERHGSEPPQSVSAVIPYGHAPGDVGYDDGWIVPPASYTGIEQWTRDHDIVICDKGYEVGE